MAATYEVHLDTFQGPLDLLLHLINELEIDIYDIPVAQITEQYMQYIHTMKQIELNIASEYLVMAATLLEIKSKMLLPKKEIIIDDEYVEEADPREALMQRLIQYRKYKMVAANLQTKELAESEVFTRPPKKFQDEVLKSPVIKGDISVFDMIGALQKVFKRKHWHAPLETKIDRIEISIEERMKEITTLIFAAKEPIAFDDLFPFPNKSHIITTFLAMLQLMKDSEINCYQDAHFKQIYLSKKPGV